MGADNPVLQYLMGIGGTVILALIGAIYSKFTSESKDTADALDKKASIDALREAKMDFNNLLEKQRAEYQQRLHEVSMRQDREIDWLKEEMDKIASNIVSLRQENTQANNMILARLHEVALAVKVKP